MTSAALGGRQAGSGRTLVLGLGNDLLADDGFGLTAVRRLRAVIGPGVDVEESGEAGLALMERMTGYDRVLLVDAILTGDHPPGTILEFGPHDFGRVVAPSPHYAGLPEVFDLARRLGVPFPRTVRVLAVEAAEVFELRPSLTPSVARALPRLVARARQILDEWEQPGGRT